MGVLASSLLIAFVALSSLWLYASATTPRMLARLPLPLAALALVLSLYQRRRAPRSSSAAGALMLSLLVLATEAAFAFLARM